MKIYRWNLEVVTFADSEIEAIQKVWEVINDGELHGCTVVDLGELKQIWPATTEEEG